MAKSVSSKLRGFPILVYPDFLKQIPLFPYISVKDEASDFKFGRRLSVCGLPMPITKSHPKEKVAWPSTRRSPKF